MLKTKDSMFYTLGLLHLGSVIVGMTLTARFFNFYLPDSNDPIHLTGGFLFIPVVFFFQDIITEIYGFQNAKKTLYITLSLFVLYVLILHLFSMVLGNQNHEESKDFAVIANTLPRQTLSFVCSLAIGGILNSFILTKLKFIFKRKFLAIRFITSTAIGEIFFQFVAVMIAWYGKYSIHALIPLAISSYLYKIIFEISTTPITVLACKYLRSLDTEGK